MQHRLRLMRWLIIAVLAGWQWLMPGWSANAAIDPYIARYLQATEPVTLAFDEAGHTRLFSPSDLKAGKEFFEQNCLNCHVGGSTLPDPLVSLSLDDLANATPRRDTIAGLVTYLRSPMTYDGRQSALGCRPVPESWLSTPELESLAGFIVRAAQKAPGWGQATF